MLFARVAIVTTKGLTLGALIGICFTAAFAMTFAKGNSAYRKRRPTSLGWKTPETGYKQDGRSNIVRDWT